jgi:hypothetical protein
MSFHPNESSNKKECKKLKEDILSEIGSETNIVSEKFKIRFIELISEFTDSTTIVAKSFLAYVDQTRRNQYLNRLIVEIEHVSSNTKLLELLTTLERNLDTRFQQSKKGFCFTIYKHRHEQTIKRPNQRSLRRFTSANQRRNNFTLQPTFGTFHTDV